MQRSMATAARLHMWVGRATTGLRNGKTPYNLSSCCRSLSTLTPNTTVPVPHSRFDATVQLTQRRCWSSSPPPSDSPSPSSSTSSDPVELAVNKLLDVAAGRVPFIMAEDATKLHAEADDVVFVDVREPPEWVQTGMVDGALPVPRGVLEFVCGNRIPLDKRVIVYCRNGFRAALAGATLLDLGYSTVMNGGGVDDLEAAGIPISPFAPSNMRQE
eukprot:m.31236 g.31236  ORF g.31236 m.31236 type:complete len:215 (+) comp16421_c0_seq1:63-707(+)